MSSCSQITHMLGLGHRLTFRMISSSCIRSALCRARLGVHLELLVLRQHLL